MILDKKEEIENHPMDSVYRLKWILMFAIFAMPLMAFNIGIKWESTIADHSDSSYLIMTCFVVIWGVLLYFINEGLTAIIQRAEMYLNFYRRCENMLDHSIANSKEMIEYIKKLESQLNDDDDDDNDEDEVEEQKLNNSGDSETKEGH